jgi:hypothetical protein
MPTHAIKRIISAGLYIKDQFFLMTSQPPGTPLMPLLAVLECWNKKHNKAAHRRESKYIFSYQSHSLNQIKECIVNMTYIYDLKLS